MTLALFVAVLVAGGVYLVMQRGMVRIIFGFVLLSHAANLIFLSAGVAARREEPLMSVADIASAADPLPQAFVLTAIVIAFAITIYLLALAATGRDDDTEGTEDGMAGEPHPGRRGTGVPRGMDDEDVVR
jgi:multicomponent Na+:H+ antiporter subunit C